MFSIYTVWPRRTYYCKLSHHSSKVPRGGFWARPCLLVISRHPNAKFIEHREVRIRIDVKAKAWCLEQQRGNLLLSGQLLVAGQTSCTERKRQRYREVDQEAIGALLHPVRRKDHRVHASVLYETCRLLGRKTGEIPEEDHQRFGSQAMRPAPAQLEPGVEPATLLVEGHGVSTGRPVKYL